MSAARAKENTGLILGVKGHLASEEKIVETSNAFSASVLMVTDLGLPGLLSWRTTTSWRTGEETTFNLQILQL